MKIKKKPLIDVLLASFDEYSEKELYAMIMCGEVSVAGETIRTPREKVDPGKQIIFKKRRFVSRGGEKLDFAIEKWNIDVEHKIALDAGSSTGGFTDCLLKRGAELVYSVDVGFNQLDYSLRTNNRVVSMEKTNIMSLTSLEPGPDFAVADLSFRSITGASSLILGLTSGNMLIALIKPQFEIEATDDFDGIIRDQDTLVSVVTDTAERLGQESVAVEAMLESPIKGGKGNVEYLFRLSKTGTDCRSDNLDVVSDFFANPV